MLTPHSSPRLEPLAPARAVVSTFGRVLILKGDRFYGEALRQAVEHAFPRAAVLVMSRLRDARVFLAAARVDLLVLGVSLPDGEALDLLTAAAFRDARFLRVLVVTGRKEARLLSRLRSLPINGVFDPMGEGMEQFERALHELAAGRSSWSYGVLECLREPGRSAPVGCRRTAGLLVKRGTASPALPPGQST